MNMVFVQLLVEFGIYSRDMHIFSFKAGWPDKQTNVILVCMHAQCTSAGSSPKQLVIAGWLFLLVDL